MLNIHIWTHCDTFHCKMTTCVSHVNGEGDRIGGMQGKSKPYAAMERADFSNPIVFDNLVQIGNYWMWTSIWTRKLCLMWVLSLCIYCCDCWCCVLLNNCCLYNWSLRRANRISECISIIIWVVPRQCQFKKYKNWFVLMQQHLMLKIFVCDASLALWIFFEQFCSKIFGTTLQD